MNKEGTRDLLCILWYFMALPLAFGCLMVVFWHFAGIPLEPTATVGAIRSLVKARIFNWPLWAGVGAAGSLSLGALFALFNPFTSPDSSYGNAHWASEKEVKKLGLRASSGMILGMLRGGYIRVSDPLCALIYAPPGSGKTAGAVIPTLLSCSNSMIVHDPKGELLDKTGPRRSLAGKVIKFAPGEAESAKWNPFSRRELPRDWADIQTAIDRIANSLFLGKDEGDFWTLEARSIFMFWALFLVHKNGETSFPEILEKALETSDPQGLIAESLDNNKDLPGRIKTEGNGLLAKAEKEFAGCLGTFKSKMGIFLDARVANNLSGSDFSLWDLRKEMTTIYLCVKNTDQSRLKAILTLFFEVATLVNLDHEPTKDELSVTLVLDEFVRLGRMQEVLEMPAIGRSFRLNAMFVCQSKSQLVGIYGREGADQLINTCAFHLFYAQNEIHVAEEISKSIGTTTRKRVSSSGKSGEWNKSKSENMEGVPLILPQEILSLPFGEIMICRQNSFETPVKCSAAFWFKDKALIKAMEDGKKEAAALPKPPENPAVDPGVVDTTDQAEETSAA